MADTVWWGLRSLPLGNGIISLPSSSAWSSNLSLMYGNTTLQNWMYFSVRQEQVTLPLCYQYQ